MNPKIEQELERGVRRRARLQLWQLGAIKVNVAEPFRLVSGNYSPIYINCRQLISTPAFADLFAAGARIVCSRRGIEFDAIAGGRQQASRLLLSWLGALAARWSMCERLPNRMA